MPTANLFLVTQTLQRLLDFNVRALLLRDNQAINISVTTMPPERVGNAQNRLNMYLYHLMEQGYYKNMPPPGRGDPPIARQPLALSLFYILTAHHEVNEVFDADRQQQLLGLAMKSFHDHALIDDNLQVSPDGGPPQTVMAPGLEGRGNRIEMSLRPLTPEESMSFWSSEQTSTARLSAYYEARTIFIEPEEPTSAHGTVFDLGLFVSAGQAPVLKRVSSISQFSPPPQTGLGPQAIEMSPARVTLAPGIVPPVNRVALSGSGLTGDGRPGGARIMLRTPAWRQLLPPVRSAPIDPGLNQNWSVEMDETSARFDMQGQIAIDDGAGGVRNLEVTPGIYAVSVETIRRQETPGGMARFTTAESNQIAFSVGARIDDVDPPNANGRVVVHVVNLFDMQANELEVQLAVDGVMYDETANFAGNAAQDRGLFQRQAGQVEFQPLFDPTQAGVHPVRLVINGGESQPFWIEAP